ncbi:MAG: DHH family phosphoesterase, partial [Oscillospiraceae bacterium]|nr:DHH family phosphoesterase [Oscillospiraceae bacterium]
SCGDRRYRAAGGLVTSEAEPEQALAAVYLVDETQLLLLKDEYTSSRPVVSVILVDNYDELTNNLPDSNVSSLTAALDERVRRWSEPFGGLIRKIERNRYLFLFEVRDLDAVMEDKFSIIESIRSVTNNRGVYATISLGIGRDGADFAEGYAFANLAIEMALARGGDQAVIKDRYNFSFYGGRRKETDRRNKVKSRVMASSLSELISQSSDIFIMGHKNADLDSLGAACGVVCLCRKLGKKPAIVIDREHNAAGILVAQLEQQPEYRGVLVSGQDALLMADPKSLLIVVDTNRPDRVESKPLLECVSRICVIDHHRRAADYIDQVVMNLHDPFASSAAELVTELLQYAVDPSDLLAVEAQALLSGIVMDTKNFGMRTSGRTFEAAAFLRRLGADTADVKKIMQNDLDSTLQRYSIVQSAQVYRDTIAIAPLDHPVSRVIAAQAADELLTIAGITSSFVVYPDPESEQVIISARSFGDVNVQVITERLGGGGNAAIAGAQIAGKSVGAVLTDLVASIDRFYEP